MRKSFSKILVTNLLGHKLFRVCSHEQVLAKVHSMGLRLADVTIVVDFA